MSNPVNGDKLQLVGQIHRKIDITNNYGTNSLFSKICSGEICYVFAVDSRYKLGIWQFKVMA